MLNTIDLEKRWFIYKIKSYVPYVIIIFSLLIISFIVYYLQTNQEKSSIQVEVAIKKTIKEKEIKQLKTPDNIFIEDAKKVKLVPSLDFMRKMQNSSQLHRPTVESVNNFSTSNKYISREPKQVRRNTVVQENIEEFTQELENEAPKTVSIERKNTQKDIYEVIKRFKTNNNPVLSLFIAKKYYEIGNYKQSYNYALITNELNKDIDESWIIFTKSLVKLGEKEKAMNILKQYIEHSHSNPAKILIKEIRSGKFK